MTARPHNTTPAATPPGPSLAAASVPLALAAIVLVGTGTCSLYAFATLVFDGALAAAVMLPAALAGLWLVPLLGLGDLPRRWRVLLGAALGIGILGLFVLALGCAGVLSRGLWIGILCAMFLAGAIRVRSVLVANTACASAKAHHDAMRWLWLLLAPMLVLGILSAVHAPGFLWAEEGWGYDVLEYHLELPKEYHTAGVIAYTPHNVYGNFPANVEMLYLLGMVLLDDDMEAGTTAHMIHLSFALLTVFAAYVGGREWSRRGGLVAALAMGSAGWLVYFSGMAYVENGLLFFGTVAAAAVLRAFRTQDASTCENDQASADKYCGRWFAVAGICAGLACGCKYTAIPMIAVPVALAALLTRERFSRRVRFACTAAITAVIAFSPWAIKNLAMTGNPVFPLANSVFQAEPEGWGMAESAHWDQSHDVRSELSRQRGNDEAYSASAILYRVEKVWDHILRDKYARFGPLLFVLALFGYFASPRDRRTNALVLILVVQLLVWLFATHLYARFAAVMLIPLTLLAGRCAFAATSTLRTAALAGVIFAGVGLSFVETLRLYRTESLPGAIAPASLIYEGKLPGYEHLVTINRELPKDAHLLVLGDAKGFYYDRKIDYCVVFNRNPFVEAIKQDSRPQFVAAWLRERGYTHLLVDQSEINRLRSSAYGFPPEVNDQLFESLEESGVIRRVTMALPPRTSTSKRLYEMQP